MLEMIIGFVSVEKLIVLVVVELFLVDVLMFVVEDVEIVIIK